MHSLKAWFTLGRSETPKKRRFICLFVFLPDKDCRFADEKPREYKSHKKATEKLPPIIKQETIVRQEAILRQEAIPKQETIFRQEAIPNPELKLQPLEKQTQNKELADLLSKTPPLRSIYLTWKDQHSAVFRNSSHIMNYFVPYGPIERVVYCSRNSAIVVFYLIRSACLAADIASKQLAQYELFVLWFPEYLQMPMVKSFMLR